MLLFSEYGERVQARITSFYGIAVVTRDIQDPLTGDLNGAEIHLDHLLGAEERLFLLGHLFGHTVQWNVHPDAFDIGRLREPPVAEADLPAIIAYERQAAAYALQLFREVGITDADQWFSDYTACDMAYLTFYYRTGEQRPFLSFRKSGTALIEPLPIPSFVPVARILRRDGVVI
jgi:hypothetical protein